MFCVPGEQCLALFFGDKVKFLSDLRLGRYWMKPKETRELPGFEEPLPVSPDLTKLPTDKVTMLRFHNLTHKNVDLIWLNLEGLRARYTVLPPDILYDLRPDITEPWMFRDSKHQTMLGYRTSELPLEEPFPCNHAPGDTMFHIKIVLPVYSLAELSMQVIQAHLKLSSPTDAYQLEIPKPWQEKIRNRLDIVNWHRRTYLLPP